MKEKIKRNKGFTLITLVIAIIVSIVTTAGIGYGTIEYRKTFKLIEEAEQLTKEEKYNEAIERLELAQSKWFGKIFKQKINAELKENRKLSAEQQITGAVEKALEKLMEVKSGLVESQPKPEPKPEPQPQSKPEPESKPGLESQEDIQLKIEKCKAEAQSQVDQFKKKANEMYLEGQETLKSWEVAILDAQIKYSECIMKPAEPGMSPQYQQQVREAECNYYLEKKSQLEKELIQEREKLNDIYQLTISMGQNEYSRLYYDCLNK